MSVRVSNALGAGLPRGARRAALTATALTFLTQAGLSAALVLGRRVWGRVFTDLPQVLALCAAAFPIMALCMVRRAGGGGVCGRSWIAAGSGVRSLLDRGGQRAPASEARGGRAARGAGSAVRLQAQLFAAAGSLPRPPCHLAAPVSSSRATG